MHYALQINVHTYALHILSISSEPLRVSRHLQRPWSPRKDMWPTPHARCRADSNPASAAQPPGYNPRSHSHRRLAILSSILRSTKVTFASAGPGILVALGWGDPLVSGKQFEFWTKKSCSSQVLNRQSLIQNSSLIQFHPGLGQDHPPRHSCHPTTEIGCGFSIVRSITSYSYTYLLEVRGMDVYTITNKLRSKSFGLWSGKLNWPRAFCFICCAYLRSRLSLYVQGTEYWCT